MIQKRKTASQPGLWRVLSYVIVLLILLLLSLSVESAVPTTSPVTSKPSISPIRTPSTSPVTSKPSKSPTTSRPSKSPSKSPVTSKPTKSPSKAPTFPTFAPTKSPTRSPTRSPLQLSKLITYEETIKSYVVIRSGKTETWTIEYNSDATKGEPLIFRLAEAFDTQVVKTLVMDGSDLTVGGNRVITADKTITVNIDVSELDASISRVVTPIRFDVALQRDPSVRMPDVVLNVEVNVLTAIVFPDTLTYEIAGDTRANSSSLNPTAMIQVFNLLCGSAVTYNVYHGGDCGTHGSFNSIAPSWLAFHNPLIFSQTTHIEAARGLPDELPFDLNFANIPRDPDATQAENFEACLTFEMNLIEHALTINRTAFISVTTVRPCPPGTSSTTGQDQAGCTKCPLGQYQPASFSTDCLRCPESFPSTLQEGAISLSDCVTAPSSFNNNGTKLNCPVGANCSETGLTLETLKLQPGYWRPNKHSLEIRRCVREHYCIGGAFKDDDEEEDEDSDRRRLQEAGDFKNGSDICLQYHEGVMCYACVPGAVKRTGAKVCSICTAEALQADQTRMGGIIFGMVLLCTALLTAFCLHSRNQFHLAAQREAKLRADAEARGGHLVASNPLVGEHAKSSGDTPVAEVVTSKKHQPSKAYRLFFDSIDVTVQLKIIIGLFQVIGGMSIAFSESLPEFFQNVAVILALLTFDLVSVFDFGCALSDQSHYASLLVSTLTPIGVIIVLLLVDVTMRYTVFKGKTAALKELDIISYTIVLLILFLVYPSVSSTILKTFDCREIGGVVVLGSDFATECTTERHHVFVIYAICCAVVYVAGIPLYYAKLLWNERKKINLDKTGFLTDRELVKFRDGQESIAYLRFLWKPYRPKAYWFEVYELLRKLIQTSVLVFVAPGTSIQMVFQLVITAFSVVVLHVFLPYQRTGNQVLALISQWVIFMITFISLLIKVENVVISVSSQVSVDVPESYNLEALNITLLCLVIVTPVVAFFDIINQLFEDKLYRKVFFCFNWKRCCGGRFRTRSETDAYLRKLDADAQAESHKEVEHHESRVFKPLAEIASTLSKDELARRADIAIKSREEEIHELHQKQREAQKLIEDLHNKVFELEANIQGRSNSYANGGPAQPVTVGIGASLRRLQALGTSFKSLATRDFSNNNNNTVEDSHDT